MTARQVHHTYTSQPGQRDRSPFSGCLDYDIVDLSPSSEHECIVLKVGIVTT